jgi:SPP1 family phage portal protein
MTIEQIEALILTADMTKVMNTFYDQNLYKSILDRIKEYDPKQHAIADKIKRPDKIVNDAAGRPKSQISVARLPLAIQKKIVRTAVAFLGVPELDSTPAEGKATDLKEVVERVWSANKLDYKFKSIARMTMSEHHAAELWYTTDVDQSYWDGYPIKVKLKISMKILSYENGDTLYPAFDQFDNLIAFGRGYKTRDEDAKEIQHFDIYTDTDIYYSKKDGNGVWLFSANAVDYGAEVVSMKNLLGKIPIIYYRQPRVEWEDVQELIERLETKISNHADTNDYFDSPIIVADGEVTGFAEKGESGKLLETKNGAKVSYLTWDQAPESTKMEIENLQKFIYSLTHTPDISFENMKGLGVFSGIALRMLFLDAEIKASEKEEMFGECIQRRINLIKHIISVVDTSYKAALKLDIKPRFNSFLPQNIAELVDVLVKAESGGIISQETAVKMNPLVGDPDAELERIKAEAAVVIQPDAPTAVR